MDRQKIFDAVWRRARDKRKAVDFPGDISCKYRKMREPNNLACFIGALIPNEEYVPAIEGSPVSAVAKSGRYKHIFGDPKEINLNDEIWLTNLQRIHDAMKPEDWRVALETFALFYGQWTYNLKLEDARLENEQAHKTQS